MRKALLDAGRKELIGDGPLALIGNNPPKAAMTARRQAANKRRGDKTFVHAKQAGVKSSGGKRR